MKSELEVETLYATFTCEFFNCSGKCWVRLIATAHDMAEWSGASVSSRVPGLEAKSRHLSDSNTRVQSTTAGSYRVAGDPVNHSGKVTPQKVIKTLYVTKTHFRQTPILGRPRSLRSTLTTYNIIY